MYVRNKHELGKTGKQTDFLHPHGKIMVILYQDAPSPPPPNFQVLPAAQVGRSKTSGARDPGWENSRAVSQAFVGACHRRAASEGSLSLTVVGSLNTKRRWRVGEVRGENEQVDKVNGGGSGRFAIG